MYPKPESTGAPRRRSTLSDANFYNRHPSLALVNEYIGKWMGRQICFLHTDSRQGSTKNQISSATESSTKISRCWASAPFPVPLLLRELTRPYTAICSMTGLTSSITDWVAQTMYNGGKTKFFLSVGRQMRSLGEFNISQRLIVML